MNIILIVIMAFFWGLLLFYSMLMLAGVYFRVKKQKQGSRLQSYPSVSILIPAHNEEIVIQNTLHAMSQLEYPGDLNIYLLDDNSTDNTAHIGKDFQKIFSKIHYIPVPPGEPKGKSRVLNYGLSLIRSTYFLVYDADNEPEPDAVRLLVEKAESTPHAAGAVGYVKTKNAYKNLLTQMIALEFQVFQLLIQCGRWQLFKIGSLAGTNMLLKRHIIEQIGGYDMYALAEDAELTIRLTAAGYLLPVEAESKTWEQEPETLKTFIKQRTRWMIGNIYLLEKVFTSLKFWRKKAFHQSMQHITVYLFFALLLLFSHICFIGGLLGWFEPKYTTPILMLWFMSYIVYTSQLIGVMVVDQDVSPIKVIVAIIMYFTYAQLFVLLLGRSAVIYLWKRFIKKETIQWDKTNRFKNRAG
ncbi:glycosyltransferase family 2 protein [Virgibacillus pantothenticus]|uniref:glycosyltransferase family 2 protein n=1 Tax=Virgibacillus pantothenticus TaxID=1473 RepID=UPI000953B62B|nr:glycosyltransferase [Virgibacillus pantothenticus]MED3737127.1 glycosyltransferase [Virgibacillus pantothenticus]QTY15038.1 glycosyltransferase family 2 protein [Virgibacillus pantothenticus]SIS76231.1 Glycosyltransferase, catalytic subunit of cellulose synthase and poly-beta-1,6-N-acetylglucosamine synthase [Virgibacillus pantothenticus]